MAFLRVNKKLRCALHKNNYGSKAKKGFKTSAIYIMYLKSNFD